MDYKKLDTMARAEGRDALRERLNLLLKQAEEAGKRNKNGEISDGLSRGIRGTRYMLERAVSAEKNPVGGNQNGNGRSAGSTLPSPSFESQQQADRKEDGRFTTLCDGVEMLSPQFDSDVVYDEAGQTKMAYTIYVGRSVKRDKHGKPVISPKLSYIPIAEAPCFRNDSPHKGCFDSSREALDACLLAIEEEAGIRQ